ncbi:hypothetical protein GQ600_22091 [Phytophthora cactorum]|nr:hypothetical protein GQ600_22091 [Phytophthora cactorum]
MAMKLQPFADLLLQQHQARLKRGNEYAQAFATNKLKSLPPENVTALVGVGAQGKHAAVMPRQRD